MAKIGKSSAEHILPLYMNGLAGRMLYSPSSSGRRREILLIYGHHAILERWLGLVENLNEYGTVTMPDMPGFGGMQSFRKIGIRSDLDAYADYLAAFIKLRYKNKRFSIFAISFGFLIVTRMLQRYPELAKKVDLLVSIVGFMHNEDLVFKPRNRQLFRFIARFLATWPIVLSVRYLFLNKAVLKFLYVRFPNSRARMIEVSADEFEKSMEMEVTMWQSNDLRTHWLTTAELLKADNCRGYVSLPVIHIVSAQDPYIKKISVEQHMRQVFSGYRRFTVRPKTHVPSVIADKKAMSILLPAGLRRLLAKDNPKYNRT